VSKFFKALETAERERAAGHVPEAAAAPAADVAEPEARRPEPVPAASPRAAAPLARPHPVSASVVAEARPTVPASVYGAPVMRGNGDGHPLGVLLDEREPATFVEPGSLDDHLVSLLQPTSFAAEQYRTLRLAMETARQQHGTRVIGVTSPGRSDGKTITALNLAGALAQGSETRVVLVEADLRHPRVARALGLPERRGLSSYLVGDTASVDSVLERPEGLAFAVVLAGQPSSMPYELLKSAPFTTLMAALRERFDFVVVDTPPVRPFPDAGILRDLVDGFLLVVRAHRTPRETLREGIAAVGRSHTLGVIFNDDDQSGETERGTPSQAWRRFVGFPREAVR
jgi:capsular exopolysaccharide synthesis family protein